MVSVIIPVLNEEATIGDNLKRLMTLKGDFEVLVVDGGSSDGTQAIASEVAKVIHSEKGRGKQMNTGAVQAKGQILWFLHSDSLVSENSIIAIEEACSKGYAGGCFSLFFHDERSFNLTWLALTSNLRAKYLKLMFGDQGIFVTREAFETLGAFPEIAIMEDWAFSRAMNKSYKCKLLKTKIGTSGRRFKEGGFFKTLMKMHWIKWQYLKGTTPEQLVKLYKEIR